MVVARISAIAGLHRVRRCNTLPEMPHACDDNPSQIGREHGSWIRQKLRPQAQGHQQSMTLMEMPVSPDQDETIEQPVRTARSTANELKAAARRLAAHCAAYRGASPGPAIWQVASTTAAFVALVALMLWSISVSYMITLALALPAAGLLIRFFIIQHDCGHGSFLPSRTANDILGRLLSVLTLTPYGLWRREHNQHHAGSGNLDRRGVGDITTLTVKEYQALSLRGRIMYRIYRNPAFLFGIGLPLYFLVLQRLPWFHPYPARQTWGSVMRLNAGLVVLYAPLMWLFGWATILMIAIPILMLSSAIGGWLFFIQHQFEGTHWEEAQTWDFQVAAIYGSSYYVLPPVLQWFTGNIGLHHIHHLCSMIPNYKLQACLDASPELKSLNRLTLWESLMCARLTLWDEANRRLIGFRELRGIPV
jgi:acyl-lipid omega-6 desaturase (Delta-12 desaturase)